jgi:ABC-type transport system involved in cytochrome c biogenesis ATPase subunit
LDVDEHRVFFGRRSELEQLAGLVRSPAERAEQAVLLVVGPSGCGKSSLVRAGLLHVMADEPGWWQRHEPFPSRGTDCRELTASIGGAERLAAGCGRLGSGVGAPRQDR